MEDGTRDKANYEFISIGLRFVKKGKVFENLVHISQLEGNRPDAASLTQFTLETLGALDLPTNRILSQCYDGGSVMSECRGSLQALLRSARSRSTILVLLQSSFTSCCGRLYIKCIESCQLLRLVQTTA